MRVLLLAVASAPSLALRSIARYAEVNGRVPGVQLFMLERNASRFAIARNQQLGFNPASEYDLLLQDMLRAEPDLVGLSCYVWNLDFMLDIAWRLKQLRPDVRVVAGGPAAEHLADTLLIAHPELDAVVQGEGEITFTEILQANPRSPDEWDGIDGVVYRAADGAVVHNDPREPMADLDAIPFPWEHDIDRLQQVLAEFPAWPRVGYESMRGCPFTCSFCLYGRRRSTFRSEDLVKRELRALLSRGVFVELADPYFTVRKERALRVFDALGGTGHLTFETRPTSLDDDLVRAIKRAPVGNIGLGVQSLAPAALAAMDRRQDRGRTEAALTRLVNKGVAFYTDIIYGLPDSTLADFQYTFDTLYDLGVDEIQCYRLLVLPGTPFWNERERLGLAHSRMPPWELLAQPTYSLDDVLTSYRISVLHKLLFAELGAAKLRTLLRGRSASQTLADFAEQLLREGTDIIRWMNVHGIGRRLEEFVR